MVDRTIKNGNRGNRNLLSSIMANGITMQLPSTTYIEDGVTFEGECIVENGCRITGNTLIQDSHIKSGSVIEDSIVKNSDVGPLAHLRPASNIENTHIGNFVEVKKSSLKGVKAGHLSYIGDAQVDEGTNIGAGVITCNYDGVKENKTKIRNNVFIGSNSSLVAPITINENSVIGAGSVITKNVRKKSLALTRSSQVEIKNYKRKK